MTAFPDGITSDAMTRKGAHRVVLARFMILFVIIGAALVGLVGAGGGNPQTLRAATKSAAFQVQVPERVRNGNLFEIRFDAVAKAPIDDVVIAIPASVWDDITINSMLPAPAEEEFADGEFRFHFGPLQPGNTVAFKVDGQFNPPLFGRVAGQYRLLDGERELARLPADMWVIP